MPLSRLITLIIDIHRFKTCGHCGVQDAGQGRLRHPHSAKRGTINSTWKDFEASSRRHRVDGFAIYVDASYSSHALLIKEHVLKNVLVLPVWTPLTPCLPIVEITRVEELQTKPFIHDVNQQSMRRPKVKRSKFGFGSYSTAIAGWWRQTGSNRRPEACKATALPTELCPRSEAASPCKKREQQFAQKNGGPGKT
jgi:hypothetical protein